MFRLLLSTLITLNLFFNVTSEVNAETAHSFESEQAASTLQVKSLTSLENESCDECPDKDCHGRDGHCAHHCFGIHHLVLNQKHNFKSLPPYNMENKTSYYFRNAYASPFIDPALKPPTLS